MVQKRLKTPLRNIKMAPKTIGRIFWIMNLYDLLKSSHQGLSNEGQKFFDSILIIDLLKHSHCFVKLQILAPSNNLRIGQNSEFAKF